MDLTSRKEIVFFYESIRANPNGDPGFDNQPRMYPDNTVMVTDVRIKRTIRDYAKKASGGECDIFVDYTDNHKAVEAKVRAEEILKKHDWIKPKAEGENEPKPKPGSLLKEIDVSKIISGLLCKTFDVPLFGALVPISENKSGSAQITGPCQFGMGKSVNEADIITRQISSHFASSDKKQHGTFGVDHVVDYALIKTIATINPVNLELSNIEKRLGKEGENIKKEIETNFINSESKLLQYLWEGTTDLVSRSKFQQRSILAVEVEYSRSYGDLDTLIGSRDGLKRNADNDDEFGFERLGSPDTSETKHHATDLSHIEFGFKRLIATLNKRSENVRNVRIACDPRLDRLIDDVVSQITKAKKENFDG